ncbi:DUF6602 domain-containing protein [Bacillus rhizoplanae]|uniref:DUF6602 domain-containing protein n=1 Tax=Bacillus rhizoplanae TaxID=2880966 RepID=UPI003D1EAEC1
MIREKLGSLQRQMELKLEEIQIVHKHRGNRGDNAEEIVREFLREYLPSLQRVGNGEIIDSTGQISNETDIVILNEYHPNLSSLTNPSVFFIEGVLAAGEVKTNLNSNDIDTTLGKCLKFKNLVIKHNGGDMIVTSNNSDKERFIHKRAFFLFAFSSQLTLETILEKVNRFNENNSLEITQQIDGIFLLDRGVILNLADGNGTLKVGDKHQHGYVPISKEEDSHILFSFLAWLNVSTPRINMFTSILSHYVFKN